MQSPPPSAISRVNRRCSMFVHGVPDLTLLRFVTPKRWLLRTARAIAQLMSQVTSRNVDATGRELMRLPFSRSSIERVGHVVGAEYLSRREPRVHVRARAAPMSDHEEQSRQSAPIAGRAGKRHRTIPASYCGLPRHAIMVWEQGAVPASPPSWALAPVLLLPSSPTRLLCRRAVGRAQGHRRQSPPALDPRDKLCQARPSDLRRSWRASGCRMSVRRAS